MVRETGPAKGFGHLHFLGSNGGRYGHAPTTSGANGVPGGESSAFRAKYFPSVTPTINLRRVRPRPAQRSSCISPTTTHSLTGVPPARVTLHGAQTHPPAPTPHRLAATTTPDPPKPAPTPRHQRNRLRARPRRRSPTADPPAPTPPHQHRRRVQGIPAGAAAGDGDRPTTAAAPTGRRRQPS